MARLSKYSGPVGRCLLPSLSSGSPRVRPGVSLSIMTRAMLALASVSSLVTISMKSATGAWAILNLLPFRR
ncbi:hypothetical protein D3C77_649160 [compost metagenome]